MANEKEFNLLDRLLDQPAGASWRPLVTEWIEEDVKIGKPASDFPTLGTTPVFSQRAVDALLDLIAPYGELLPLQSPTGCYFVYNVTHVIDALDEDRSELVRCSDGGVMRMVSHAFKSEVVQHQPVFKVPQLRGTVFVSDVFARRIREADLSGVELRPL